MKPLFLLLAASAAMPAWAADWTPIPAPAALQLGWKTATPIAASARDYNAPAGLPARVLFDNPVRDPHILHAPDGYFYMVATAAKNTLPASIPARPDSDFWTFNDGIPLWRSRDLVHWETLGYVWQFERDGTWQKALKPSPHTGDGKPVRAIWAPEIQYAKGTYWILYSMNYDGTGLLKSTSGKPEGPYVDMKPAGPISNGIDATLFEDGDGAVYWLDFGYRIAKMNADMTDIAEPMHDLKFAPNPPWGEGINMKKVGDLYVWTNAGRESGSYDAYSATSKSIEGPYLNRYRAIPYAGHNDLFQDDKGNWFSTLFHPNDYLNLGFRPAIVPLTMDKNGIIAPKRSYARPTWKYAAALPIGDWKAAKYDDKSWKSGEAGFGDAKIEETGPITDVATPWLSGDLWLRRDFQFSGAARGPQLFVRANGPLEISLNGREIYRGAAAMKDYVSIPVEPDALKKGANVLAVHAAPGETPYFDAGLWDSGERVLLPIARDVPAAWSYTLEKPAADWMNSGFDAANWPHAPGGFGTLGGAKTEWKTDDIWLRREFRMGATKLANPTLRIFHDEDAQIYINGILAAEIGGFTGDYVDVAMSPASAAALKVGANLIAVHCRQTGGGQFIDVGIVDARASAG